MQAFYGFVETELERQARIILINAKAGLQRGRGGGWGGARREAFVLAICLRSRGRDCGCGSPSRAPLRALLSHVEHAHSGCASHVCSQTSRR